MENANLAPEPAATVERARPLGVSRSPQMLHARLRLAVLSVPARRLLALALGAGACGGTPAPPAPPAAEGEARGAPRIEAAVKPEGPAAVDPRIARAIAPITEAMLRTDVGALATPRHATGSRAGLDAAAAHVERELRAAGLAVTRQPVTHGGARADNVIGELPAPGAGGGAMGEGDGVVLVTAHYDAVLGSPGADDNASGVAGALAVARAVARARPRGAVRIVAFAFEEEGMVGSRAYVASLAPSELSRIRAVFNLEMIGYRDARPGSQRYPPGFEALRSSDELPKTGHFIGVIGLLGAGEPVAALEDARVYVPDLAIESVLVPKLLIPLVSDVLRSDHAPFWMRGVPAAMLGDTAELRNPHYHRASDLPETLDFAFMRDVSRLVAAATLEIAGLP